MENPMENCLFCKIIRGEIPSGKVYEDDQVYAFRDINPQAPVHVLIVPKKHCDSLSDTASMTDEALAACLRAAANIAEAENLSEGYRLVSNCGPHACQSVKHLHFHLLGGRQMADQMS